MVLLGHANLVYLINTGLNNPVACHAIAVVVELCKTMGDNQRRTLQEVKMALADDIIDRQRLRRKLGFWRIAAIIAVGVVLIGAIVQIIGNDTGVGRSVDHIAHVTISGAITGGSELLERLESVAENDNVKGVIVTMNSPGGTTAGGEALYDAVKRINEIKPVVTQVDTMAASAGYMIASASDHIVARKTSIVGSIGVIFQYPKINGLLETVGIEMRSIKSSPLKAEPSFYGETPPGAETMIETMLLDSFVWFKDLVAQERGFTPAQINALADGSVFTGRQAVENGLVDSLGGMQEAEAWLKAKDPADELTDDLPVLEWRAPPVRSRLLFSNAAVGWLAQRLGLPVGYGLTNELADRLLLDGLLSVWHVQ